MPNANPVNSSRVIGTSAYAGDQQAFRLTQRYHWDALSAGVCPNGSNNPASPQALLDTDVQVRLSTSPAGTTYSLLGDNLFWLQNLLQNAPADVTSHLNFLNPAQPPVHEGQVISYTLRYRNRGSDTAHGVYAALTPLYALSLPGGRRLGLGDIGPGDAGEVSFQGIVDTGLSTEPWAAVEVQLFDSAHPDSGAPLDWLWVHHRVDRSPPRFFGITQPAWLLRPGANTLHGYAFDDAGVPTMRVEIQSPGGTSTLDCPDGAPGDGDWTCDGDVAAHNGDLVSLRLQATDGFGQTSGWSAWQPFLVDGAPPTVTVDLTATNVFSGALLRSDAFTLVGDVSDNGGVEGVDVCVDGKCRPASLLLSSETAAATYDDVPDTPVAIDGSTTCGGSEIVRTFAVTQSFTIGDVSLGFVAEHPHRDDIRVDLQSPAGTSVRVLTDDGVSGTAFANYDVLLNDAAAGGMGGDHDPTAPFYEHNTRPYEPLRAFQGENAAGTWRLRICDLNPSTDDGQYERSRLVLTPRDRAAKSSRWLLSPQSWGARGAGGERLDYVAKTITIYGQDVVGNRTTDPLRMAVWVDNVPPAITTTTTISEEIVGQTRTVLSGVVTDGGPTTNVWAAVESPNGDRYRQRAARDGENWWFDLEALTPGRYRLWVVAGDLAGNATTTGPFTVMANLAEELSLAVEDQHDPLCVTWHRGYDITVQNNRDTALTGLVVTDTLPQKTYLLSDWTTPDYTYDPATRKLVWSFDELGPLAQQVFSLELGTNSTLAEGEVIENWVTASSNETEPTMASAQTTMSQQSPPCNPLTDGHADTDTDGHAHGYGDSIGQTVVPARDSQQLTVVLRWRAIAHG